MDPKKILKIKKSLPEGFADTLESMDTAGLKVEVARLALYIEETEEARDSNETICALKSQLKDLTGPFSDTLKVLKNKIRYIYLLLEERGVK